MPSVQVNDLVCYYEDDYLGVQWETPATFLLQAGYAANSAHFATWVPGLADRYRVLRRDAVGHGRTSRGDPGRELSLEALALDVVAFLDVLDIESVHYVGERTGGMTGIVLGALHPQRLKSLTVYGCPTICGQPLQDAMHAKLPADLQMMYAGWCDAIAGLGGAFAWHDAVGWLRRDDEPQNQWQLEQLRRCDEALLERYARATIDFDVRPYLDAVRVPTLILAPTGSYRTDLSQQVELRQTIPCAELEIVEGQGGRADDPVAAHACRRIREFIDDRSL
jgi:pimeloyl-ACP methyl ester carboxylesterase